MKKLLLGVSIVLGSILSTKAQTTILSENFETSQSSMPSGWHQQLSINDPSNMGWEFSNEVLPTTGILANEYMAPSGSYFAFVNDADYNTGPSQNYDTLYTPILNCSSYVHVILSFSEWYLEGYYNNPPDTEMYNVAVSIDGGHTFTTVTHDVAPLIWGTETYDLSSLVGTHANVVIAFCYNDMGLNMFGCGLDNVLVTSPANYDLSVTSQKLPALMQKNHSYTFSGNIYNNGGDSIVSMNMNYSVNGGATQTQTISGISGFNALDTYTWSMNSVPFVPSTTGNYTVKFWADNLNGNNVDQNHANDTLVTTFYAFDSLAPRASLYEEFTGQSCVFCMIAAPNMDSVFDDNAATSNIIRYHVPIPGRDFMYGLSGANTGYVVSPRESYYSVTGAPSGFLNGTKLNPSTYLQPDSTKRYSSYTVQGGNSVGSPIAINITSAGFNAAKDSFYVSASITAYAAFASGLKVQAALTIDSVNYPQDMSEDDPQQEFAPPIGTNDPNYSYPGAPDYYFPFVLNFTHVLENMFPSASGTSLSAFTSGQTQTISFGWKQSHPWGQYPNGNATYGDSTVYHSSSTGQIVVFVQTNSAISGDGIPAKYVFQSASAPVDGMKTYLGMQQLSDGVYFEMYPNPTNNITNLSFKIEKEQNVNVEVYNMLGEQVYSVNEGTMTAGSHLITIDGSGFKSGVYFVRFNTDKVTTTQKLIIQR